MNIKTYDIIKYIIDNEYIIIQNSNIVNIKLINPIILFKQFSCGDSITIKIKNTSGTNIKNLVYFECNNENETRPLGCLKNDECIIFKIKRKNKCQKSFIKYDILIGKQKNTMYIKIHNNSQILCI